MFAKERAKIKINFRPLVVVFLSLMFGIVSARKLYSGDGVYIALTAIVIVATAAYCILKKKYVPILLVVIFCFGGHGLYFASLSHFMGKEYSDATISARVCEVDYNDDYTYLRLENLVADGDKVSGAIIYVRGAEEGDFSVGDSIVCTGELSHVKMFEVGKFYSSYYRNKVAYKMDADISTFTIVKGDPHLDESARAKIKEVLFENMSEKTAGVAYAVLTGGKDEIDGDVNDAYRSAGIVHLITVSGLHITFLSGLIAWILKKLRVNRFVNFSVITIILLLYSYICGYAPSVVRATIMGICFNLSLVFGREYDGLNSLSVAGILTLLISPLTAYDVGFQMSYACVGAILLIARPITELFKKFLPRSVAGTLAVSVAAQIGVLPFLASFFSTFNLLSVFANLLIIPFFSVLFPLLVVLVVVTLLIPPIAPILKVGEWGFTAIEYVARFFAGTNAKINLIPFDAIVTTLIFAATVIFSYYVLTNARLKWIIVAAITLMMGTYMMIRPNLYSDSASVGVYENHASTSLVLKTESGEVLVVGFDGSNTKYYLSAIGESKVDYVISPADYLSDYYGAKVILDSEGFAGSIKYSFDSGIYTFEFDGHKILFTNLSKSGYNCSRIEQVLSRDKYDFVYAKNYEATGDYFLANSLSGGDYSLKSGSLNFNLANKKVRSID